MWNSIVVLACLVCISHARKLQTSVERLESSKPTNSPSNALALLLLETNPAAAFNSFDPGAGRGARHFGFAGSHASVERKRNLFGSEVSVMREDRIDNLNTEDRIDIYRDTPLRYAGYLNEVGEAFRPLVDVNVVYLSYFLALSYVTADAASKGDETAKSELNRNVEGCGIVGVIDTLSFQLLASIIFPSLVINRWVALVAYLENNVFDVVSLLENTLGVSGTEVLSSINGVDITVESIASTIPTAAGLALIPPIVAPIDAVVEKILEGIVRPALERWKPECTLPYTVADLE